VGGIQPGVVCDIFATLLQKYPDACNLGLYAFYAYNPE